MKLKISSIMAFFIYHIIFINLYYVSKYDLVVDAFCVIVLIILCIKFKYFTNKRYKEINILLFAFIIVILISSFYNKVNMHRGILYAIKILEIFLFWEYVHQRKEQKSVIKIFLYLTMIYLIITDMLLLFKPSLYLNNSQNYLLGNKFHVSYLHILLFAFYSFYTYEKKNIIVKILKGLIWILAITVSITTECNTAVIGCILIIIGSVIAKKKNMKSFNNPRNIILTLIISSSMLLYFSGVLHVKPVEYFIVNVLNEDLTLTGRMNIYEKDLEVIPNKLFLGYGYGNSYDVMFEAMGAPNTQNGLLECILNFGVIGTILLIIIIYKVFKDYDQNNNMNSIILYLYVFAILGMIEITIDITYIALIAMLNNGKIKALVGEKSE